MRKLKLQLQMTLDGFIAGPNHEMDWMTMPWTSDINQYVGTLTEPIDTILLGRKLAEGFIPAWEARPNEPGADKFNHSRRIVFSKTLKQSPWQNAEICSENLAEKVKDLKKEKGGDIIAYGGATFAASLTQQRLIDEYYFFINPVALGSGLSIFKDIEAYQRFKLLESRSFECGITVFKYQLT